MINDLCVLLVDQQRQALNELSGQMYGNRKIGFRNRRSIPYRNCAALVSKRQVPGRRSGDQQSSPGVRGQSPDQHRPKRCRMARREDGFRAMDLVVIFAAMAMARE